jgi:DNA (cytosine-5)-methyltransferase 1
MKYFSMFSGIGGFELGIGDRGECIGYSEIDKYAIKIYESHFTHRNYGNATAINTDDLPDFDLLVGGFPCQAFSVAGKRRGFDEARGTLFFEIARVLRDKRPRNFVLENVKGLLSHDSGKTFSTILGVLTNLGYFVEWEVLNSKDFGVPQNRERVFIVGHLGGVPSRKIFPLKNSGRSYSRDLASTAIDSNYWKGIDNHGQRTAIASIPVLTPDRAEKRQNGRRFKEAGDPSFTLTAQDKHGIYDGMRIRRLTPKECERLQGFPDQWTAIVSDSQRYKCLGNAVTVNVVEAIMSQLLTQ